MKRFSEQFYTKAQSVKLQAIEREELRKRIVSYMEYHPIEGVSKISTKKATESPYQPFIQLPISMIARFSATVAALVLIVVPVMAEQSVPGDTLYAVKVRFNEEVISTLKLTPYEKVEWETERLNRRIAEARLLANEGKLTEEVEAEIVAAVQEHTESVEAGIEALRADDADQAVLASIELNTTLQTQSDALQEVEGVTMALAMTEATGASDNSTQKLSDVINASLTKQEGAVETVVPAYEKIMARVEVNTTRAYELLNSRDFSSDPKRQQDISRRLDDVSRTIERANGMRGKDDALASEALLDALQRTKKIIVFLSDAGVTTDIDSLVPIEYTNEELNQQLVALNQDVNQKIEIITALSSNVSTDASAKALYVVDLAKSNQQTIASSTEAIISVGIARESVAMLDDILRIFNTEGVGVHTVEVVREEETASTSPEAPATEEASQTN
ncbi:MAG: hypothetical protein KBC62_04700 [Candidatus Pacebacteria bacterium]|nr:hypothetical protein [Candidatus Paceibacterota bacterium]